MEEVPRKRPGRPRKNMADANAAPEGADVHSIDDGNGSTCAEGTAAQAEPSGSGQGLSWDDLLSVVKAKNSADYRIVCVFHNDAPVNVFETPAWGCIRVEAGKAGYQLNTGEIVEV